MTAISLLKSHHIGLDDRVSLITEAKYRYEGTVTAINLADGTLCLRNVTYHGAERRKVEAPDQNTVGSVFDSITFWINNIIDLKKLNSTNTIKDSAVVRTDESKPTKLYSEGQNRFYDHGRNFYPGRGKAQPYSWSSNSYRGYNQPRFDNKRRFNSYQRNYSNRQFNRMNRRYNTHPTASQPPVDCSAPYDFESANAELEKELAKLAVNEPKNEILASGDSSDNGNNLVSSSGQATVNVSTNLSTEAPEASETKSNAPNGDVPCYQPTKSFFDNIGRSMGGLGKLNRFKSPNAEGAQVANNTQTEKEMTKPPYSLVFKRKRRFNRRERVLNMETFGSIAAKPRQNIFKFNNAGTVMPSVA